MSVSVSMPQLGESVMEGTVTRWLKKEDERVEVDEPLLEVSTDKAAEARAYGLTSADLRDWASFSPIEIYWALKHDLTPAAARRWAREGLRVSDTVRAIALGMHPDQVRPWAHAGFAPSDAVEAKEMGVPLKTALAWRAAGFIVPDAALLIQDG